MILHQNSSKMAQGALGAGVLKPSQGLLEVQTIFIIILTGYLPFYSHFLMSVQWSFPELYDMWICKRLNIEAVENPATSIVRHKKYVTMSLICLFWKIESFFFKNVNI